MTIPPSAWPYLLVIPALLIGLAVGYWLRAVGQRRRMVQPTHHTSLPEAGTSALPTQQSVPQVKSELSRLEAHLASLNQEVARIRQQIREQEQEHDQLLLTLEERRASLQNVRAELQNIEQSLRTRKQEADNLAQSINASLEELELLTNLKETYTVRINRLTQQVQWQDSELRMLRQAFKAKTAEIEEAQALLKQREADLRRLIRQRQQREADLEHARQLLTQRDDELRRLFHYSETSGQMLIDPEQSPSHSQPSYAVTGGRDRPMLVPGVVVSKPEIEKDGDDREWPHAMVENDDKEDDLTLIPGLAQLYARQLNDLGIKTFQELARADAADLERRLKIPGHYSPDISRWIETARKLAGGRTTETSS